MSMDIDSHEITDKTRSDKNAHLKGRRRFKADLDDMVEDTRAGFGCYGYIIKKLRPGDEEGTVEVIIHSMHAQRVSLNMTISDTSDYPKSHSFFAYSPESDVPPQTLEMVENMHSGPSLPIRDFIVKVLQSLAGTQEANSQETDAEDEGSDDGYEAFDEMDTATSLRGVSNLDLQQLQNDFIETVATGYRPGIIRFGDDDFAISISIPVIDLANSIPPRALMAWDRRLLAQSQHLTLLISGFRGVYPPTSSDGTYAGPAHSLGAALTFKVGLTKNYKPGKEYAKDASRTFGLIIPDAEEELRIQTEKDAAMEGVDYDEDEPFAEAQPPPILEEEEEEEEDNGRFDRFSLSGSLESLLDQALLKVVQLRRKFGVGWAGAEVIYSEMERSQSRAEDIFKTHNRDILAADKEERVLGRTNDLPHDPLAGLNEQDAINMSLTTFCYLMRRLMLCTKYCIVCHNKLVTDFEALKPYVCGSKLCAYQYYSLNRGPSLEYEIIRNPQTVDLLVSLTHSAASEQALEDLLPIGLGLRVPLPNSSKIQQAYSAVPVDTCSVSVGADGLCDFDSLTKPMMRTAIVQMLDLLPAIDDMKKHLERKVKAGRAKPKLKDMDHTIIPAAWSILRWCVGSCTAYLEEITSSDESVRHIDPTWRQFRFSVGAPDAEAKFQGAIKEAQRQNANAQSYPTLYAFHGSSLKNWHSIIHHGLWYKTVTHGRAYGDGVYLAKEGNISMGGYAQPGRSTWRKSKICPTSCVALAEIVNLPGQFRSSNPYYVVQHTHWIVCRYLLVKGIVETPTDDGTVVVDASNTKATKSSNCLKKDAPPLVKLDPAQPITLNHKRIEIPEPSHEIEVLLSARMAEYIEEENDPDDVAVFEPPAPPSRSEKSGHEDVDMYYEEDDDFSLPASQSSASKTKGKAKRDDDDWQHDANWVIQHVENLMPPPVDANPSATMAVQRELKTMLKEQDSAKSLRDLGWYMPPDLIGDNLFQWIVELHSFDETLPIAKDLKSKKINSIIFEIRFPPSFPLAPPFFRIVTPRFLPFIQGGGGHVTGGGSICMDLLTADGWLPSYSISAVLMQIKLAISNLEPRPARLSSDYNRPYGVQEAWEGYKRAAATHGWRIPTGLEKLVR